MQTGGDAHAGFSANYDPETRVIRISGWGFWSVEVATTFEQAVLAACSDAPKGSMAVMDMQDLKPLRDEGQAAFSSAVGTLKRHGSSQVSVRTTSHLTKLQLMRVLKEAGTLDSVKFD